MRRNPHTTEWVITGVRPLEEAGLLKLAGILVSWGYGSGYSWRRVKGGQRDAIGITLQDVPEISVPDPTDYSTARAPGGPHRHTNNIATITAYLGQYGRVSGTTTYSRTPSYVVHPKKPQRGPSQDLEQAAFAQRVRVARERAAQRRPLPDLLQKGYLQAKGMGKKNPAKKGMTPALVGFLSRPSRQERAGEDALVRKQERAAAEAPVGELPPYRAPTTLRAVCVEAQRRKKFILSPSSAGESMRDELLSFRGMHGVEPVLLWPSTGVRVLSRDLRNRGWRVSDVDDPHWNVPKKNPVKVAGLRPLFDADVYDPRTESVRAVARGTGGMWGVAVGRYSQSRSPAEIVQRSWERYQDVDHLVRARQEYELMLGRGRQSGPLRVTAEPTVAGIRHFVWPLPASRPLPHAHKTLQDAEREIASRYRDNSPIARALPTKTYTKGELVEWLPPDSVFDERSGTASRVLQQQQRKQVQQRPEPVQPARQAPPQPHQLATHTMGVEDTVSRIHQYRAVDPLWSLDPVLMAAFRRGEPPPRR